jgi:ABC-type nitrate/sulfonate/bicarbonate transport system substrate-binding protein
MRQRHRLILCAALLAAVFAAPGTARALDTVHVGKAAAVAWTFTIPDIGKQEGIFEKYGINLDISAEAGDAKVQQALASKSLEFGLGSGPSMAFTVKGAPQIGVAAFAGSPLNICIIVGADSPIKTVKDLKGKTVSVTTAGSLTEWLAKQLSLKEGFGPGGINIAALGAFSSALAAMRTHQVDGIVGAVEAGLKLEELHQGRILVNFGKYEPDFITHVIYARRDLVKDNPDLVRRFLKGFFATIAFMKTHKEKTVEITMHVLNSSKPVMEKVYDSEIGMFSKDGTFDPAALKVLKASWVELHTLPSEPENSKVFSSEFVPVKP